MNFLDKAFDKAVEMTKPVQLLADGLKACAEQMKNLAETLAIVVKNQAVHQQMISQMWTIQQSIFRKLNTSSVDTSMPSIGADSDKKSEKPS